LKVGTVGYFAEGELEKKTIPIVHEDNHLDWDNTNNQLFDMYENIYLNKSFSAADNAEYLANVKVQTENIMRERFGKYSI
jgi:hypothetical protein